MTTGDYYKEMEYLDWWLNSKDAKAVKVRIRMVNWAQADVWMQDYATEDDFLSSYDVCKRAVEILGFDFYKDSEVTK